MTKQKTSSLNDLVSETLYDLNRNSIVEMGGTPNNPGAPIETLADEAAEDAGVVEFIQAQTDELISEVLSGIKSPVARFMRKNGLNVATDDLNEAVQAVGQDQMDDLIETYRVSVEAALVEFTKDWARIVLHSLND